MSLETRTKRNSDATGLINQKETKKKQAEHAYIQLFLHTINLLILKCSRPPNTCLTHNTYSCCTIFSIIRKNSLWI